MAFPPKPPAFENSAQDKEPAGNPFGVEGSPREEAHDSRQIAGHAKKPNPPFKPFGKHPAAKPA